MIGDLMKILGVNPYMIVRDVVCWNCGRHKKKNLKKKEAALPYHLTFTYEEHSCSKCRHTVPMSVNFEFCSAECLAEYAKKLAEHKCEYTESNDIWYTWDLEKKTVKGRFVCSVCQRQKTFTRKMTLEEIKKHEEDWG